MDVLHSSLIDITYIISYKVELTFTNNNLKIS